MEIYFSGRPDDGDTPGGQAIAEDERGTPWKSAYATIMSIRPLRALKKKMQREGIFREMKLRRSFEKPSERRARERAEAVRRHRKMLRKRLEREGY